jgi:hypothetical protein
MCHPLVTFVLEIWIGFANHSLQKSALAQIGKVVAVSN